MYDLYALNDNLQLDFQYGCSRLQQCIAIYGLRNELSSSLSAVNW